jgi:hypothetical protein
MKHAFLALVLGVAAAPAWAQNPPSTAPAPPTAPPGSQTVPPERIAPPAPGGSVRGGTMSDQLSKDHGTIAPPGNVDPGMNVHPGTRGSTMPVIPPPGSPGGNPSVVPK